MAFCKVGAGLFSEYQHNNVTSLKGVCMPNITSMYQTRQHLALKRARVTHTCPPHCADPQAQVARRTSGSRPMLPHTYTQTNKEVVLFLPLAADVRAKEVQFKCTSQQLSLSVRGVELKGEFFLAVKPDESTWELEDEPAGRRLRVGLCKARPNHKWDCCFLHEVDVSHHTLALPALQPSRPPEPTLCAVAHRIQSPTASSST